MHRFRFVIAYMRLPYFLTGLKKLHPFVIVRSSQELH